MRIAIGSDHAGFRYKERLRQALAGEGHEVTDFGTDSDQPVDYPQDFMVVPQAGQDFYLLNPHEATRTIVGHFEPTHEMTGQRNLRTRRQRTTRLPPLGTSVGNRR